MLLWGLRLCLGLCATTDGEAACGYKTSAEAIAVDERLSVADDMILTLEEDDLIPYVPLSKGTGKPFLHLKRGIPTILCGLTRRSLFQ